MKLSAIQKKIKLKQKYGDTNGLIYSTDALNFLNQIPGESVDLVFLDPPFNLNKKYSNKKSTFTDKMNEKDYISYISKIIHESHRILKDGGSIYFYHIPKFALIFGNILREVFNFRHWISISMKNGFPVKNKLYPAHYGLLYFTKGEPTHFSRPKLMPVTCRTCGEYVKDYGGYKKFIEKGINLSDVWEDISPVRHSKFKHRSSNQLPEKIMHRIYSISTEEGYIIVDPFVGSGTTAKTCLDHSLKFIVNDREKEAITVTKKRIKDKLNEE